MSDKKLKVGVIGVGALGRHHARLYAASPNAEVVGIFDVQKETADAVGGFCVYCFQLYARAYSTRCVKLNPPAVG